MVTMAPTPAKGKGQQTLSNMWKKAPAPAASARPAPQQTTQKQPEEGGTKKSSTSSSSSSDSFTPPPSAGKLLSSEKSSTKGSLQDSPTPVSRSSAPLKKSSASNGTYKSMDRPASVSGLSASPSPAKELTPPQSSPMDMDVDEDKRDSSAGARESQPRRVSRAFNASRVYWGVHLTASSSRSELLSSAPSIT